MKQVVTLKDLYKYTHKLIQNPTGTLGLFSNQAIYEVQEMCKEYEQYYEDIDRAYVRNKGFFAPVYNVEDLIEDGELEEDSDDMTCYFKVWLDFTATVRGFLNANAQKYAHLYNIAYLEYKPLQNYDMEENGTDKTKSNATTSRFFDAVNQTSTYGEQTDTTVRGEQTVTTENGAKSEATNYGAKSSTDAFGEKSTTDNFGDKSVTDSFGKKKTTDAFGQKETDTNYGSKTDTNTYGTQHSEQTNGVAGFNSSNYQNQNKQITDTSSHVDSSEHSAYTDTSTAKSYTDTHETDTYSDSHLSDAYTDTHTNAAYSDTHSNEAYTDTHTNEASTDVTKTNEQTDKNTRSAHEDTNKTAERNDSENTVGSDEVTHQLYRSGNIGVTTSQQMLESEQDFWSRHRFWESFIDDVIANFCTFHDDGYSATATPLQNELFNL